MICRENDINRHQHLDRRELNTVVGWVFICQHETLCQKVTT